MEELIDCELYHIHSLCDKSEVPNKYSEQWKIGSVLSFECDTFSKLNLLSERSLKPFISLGWETNLIKKLSKQKVIETTLKENRNIQKEFYQQGFLTKYFQFANEIILEEVRKQLFPNKPSRLNGIWLTNKENLKKWIRLIPKDEFPQKIFLVKFTGKAHKADGRWISNSTFSFNTLFKNAISYWNGDIKSDKLKSDEEYICCGSLLILEELKSGQIKLL